MALEKRAAERFRAHGHPGIADAPAASPEIFMALWTGHDVLVAVGPDGEPVGFAAAVPVDRFLHLAELSVDPNHGRIGVGRALVGAIVALARERGLAGVTLTTFRAVPFNAPFYVRLGFAEMPMADAPEVLREQFLAELPPLVAVDARVLMIRRL